MVMCMCVQVCVCVYGVCVCVYGVCVCVCGMFGSGVWVWWCAQSGRVGQEE